MKIVHSLSNFAAINLAAEVFLFNESDDEFLLVYINEPSIIVGANQVIVNEVNVEFCKEQNIQLFRRVSGGGAVYHDLGNLNYSFITNKKSESLALDGNFLNPIVKVLNSFDVEVVIGRRKDLWLPGGFKISGTAANVSKNRVMQHGTLLYDSELTHLQTSLNSLSKDEKLKGTASVPSPVKNIRNYLIEKNAPAPESKLFFNDFLLQLGIEMETEIRNFTDDEITEISKIAHSKFTQFDWIYKK